MKRERHISLAASAILAFAAGAAMAKDPPDRGLRFDSPGMLDLAQRGLKNAAKGPMTIEPLSATASAAIAAAPAIGLESPQLKFSEDEFGCKQSDRKCAHEHEAKLLAAVDGSAKRIDKRLTIAIGAGQPAEFVDWTQAETKSADGDSETHWYLGRMVGNGYHRVEVQFGHDAPGSFLINPQSGKIAFVHNGSDLVALSPDGMHMLTFNAENPPLSVRVAALDAAGPRLELVCAARERDAKTTATIKGWRSADSFDLVLATGGEDAYVHAMPLRFTYAANAWRVATADPARLSALGFTCR